MSPKLQEVIEEVNSIGGVFSASLKAKKRLWYCNARAVYVGSQQLRNR